MFDFSIVKEYVPWVTTILATLLTYSFGFRKGKKDKFNVQIEENLAEILSPMVHILRIINREQNIFQREKLLKNFFLKFSSEDTKLYKMPNKFIVDWYYGTESFFYKFVNDRESDSWEKFWICFYKFNTMINNEYNSARAMIYSDYKWLIDLNKKNFFLRLILEFFVLIYEFIKFFITMCFIFVLGFIVDNIQGNHLIPQYIKQLVLIALAISLIIYGTLFACLSEYASAKQMQRESYIIKFLQRKFPKIFRNLNSITNVDIEKEKKKIKIPKMYE